MLLFVLVLGVALDSRNANKNKYMVEAREIRMALSCKSVEAASARFEPSRLGPGGIIGWPSKLFPPLPNHEVHMGVPPSPCTGVEPPPPPSN